MKNNWVVALSIQLLFVSLNTPILKEMKSLSDLKQAIADKKQMVWNDPEPIQGNDYTINFIEDLDEDINDDDMVDYPILIQYNDFGSEAQVYLHEILLKKD